MNVLLLIQKNNVFVVIEVFDSVSIKNLVKFETTI